MSANPRRALFFSSYTGLGGGETSLLGLLGHLDRSRYRPVLCCPRDGQLPVAARALDIEVHVVPWRGSSIWFEPWIWSQLPATTRIRSLIDRLAPDIVYSDFHTLPYVAAIGRHRRWPLVFGCYGWWFRPRPWQRALYRQPRLTVVAISDAVKRGFLGEPPFIDPGSVPVVPFGVDPMVFRPRPGERDAIRRQFGLPVGKPVITLVGRFQDVKGQHVFLDMAKRLLTAHPEFATFALAGENVFGGAADEAYKARVLAIVASDPVLLAAVRMLGWVSRTQDLIAASDVVVCASRFESFGMVHLEAMACEVPIVSTNVGGPTETVVDGVTGFLVPPERPDLLADRVRELVANPELRSSLGAAGRARVRSHFTVDRYAESMADAFDAALRSAITSR